ncbi:MAG: hypothetical protein IJ737_07845 [Ruminococcus sp.]|nr:hypothetical protein [Ruminococcus sp.]
MKKSVYSIVLADDVVAAVDELAYSMNVSRSDLINRILAERVSLSTPEMRMQQIFDLIENTMEPRFRFGEQAQRRISIKSPVRYKYKPTMRYVLEMDRSFEGRVGRLRASFRTTSEALVNAIDRFFLIWNSVENEELKSVYPDGVPAESGEGRYERDLYIPGRNGGELLRFVPDSTIAAAVSGYIRLMDSSIQLFFDALSEGRDCSAEIKKAYRNYIAKGVRII